jgi:Leucine-rich repeat (LRR) protein
MSTTRRNHSPLSLLITAFLLLTTLTPAQESSIERARTLASQFLMQQRIDRKGLPDTPSLHEVYQSPDTVPNRLFCFQDEISGFVILVEHKGELIITGFAPEGVFDTTAINPALRSLMSHYEQASAINIPQQALAPAKGKASSVNPLLGIESINWNQNGLYSAACPYDAANGTNALAGCVAVTMGQIMRYHKYPATGTGSNSYTHPKYGVISANFGNTTYQWNDMPGEPTGSSSAIATLLFHAGVGVNMNYGPFSSSAFTTKAVDAFRNYFRYPDAQLFSSFNYGDDLSYFYQVIRDEINNNRPVYYELLGNAGHTVVCDGYNGNLFHLNFGWGGSNNGYFLLEGTTDGFIMKGDAIIGISPTPIPTNVQDSLALVAIYNSTAGSQWIRKSGWLTLPVNKWQGVTAINGRVIKVDLAQNRLTGTIPSEIGNLTAIRWLKLGNNALSGSLPASIGNLTLLNSLEINTTSISGSIPSELGNLTKLQTLNLSGCKFTGPIPPALASLTSLTYLNLGSNLLTGTLPTELGQLTRLKYFSVWKNQLTGSLPAELGNLADLTEFFVSANQFSGSIPGSISAWTNLTEFSISENLFEGALPDAVLSFTKLTALRINDNKFTSIPENIGNLTLLQVIDAKNNLIATLPASVSSLTALYRLDLINNRLTTLPELGEMPALYDLRLNNNLIEKLPDSFGSFTKLYDLYLGNNLLTELPSSFENLSKLRMVALTGNKLTTIPVSFCFLSSLKTLVINNNQISGPLPPLNFLEITTFDIRANRLSFSDIASTLMPDDIISTDSYEFNYHDQAKMPVSDTLLLFSSGDSIGIDIRSLSRLSHPANTYQWYSGNDLVQEGPVLIIKSFDASHEGLYSCRVRNTKYRKVLQLETEPLRLQLANIDPLAGGAMVSSRASASLEFSDELVMLVPAASLRGEIQWQASLDSVNWVNLSADMNSSVIKDNIVSFADNTIKLQPKNDLLFRYLLNLENCDPVISDTIRVNAYGDLLIDTLLNVVDKSVTIAVDSIEVTIPANFTTDDFRLKIRKLKSPPAPPESRSMASVYDVTVSTGSVFETPLLIKLKNIDKDAFTPENIDKYKAVYFDDADREWVEFNNSGFSLKDSALLFETYHLTKLSWMWDEEVMWGYTDVFKRNNIKVFYKELDEDFMTQIYGRSQSPQPWHLTEGQLEYGTPVMIQDIAHFLYEVMEAYRGLNLPVPDHVFSVYVKEMDDYGSVGLMGLLNHYLNISRDIESPEMLRSLLAHEFMHYTQDNYIAANAGNIFWMEAHAHLSDRLVWDETVIPVSESETYLLDGRTGENNIFRFLANSWDYWDKGILTQNTLGNVNYCYQAGTFLHYMRSYKEGTKLKPDVLLKETPYFQSWLNYLDSYIQQHLTSDIGTQYDEFVRYIVDGSNPNFTLLNHTAGEDPLKFLKTASEEFMTNKFYKFTTTASKRNLKDSIRLDMPYLSSKMVQVYNLNIDHQKVLVKYKRVSEQNANSRVYLGRYDNVAKRIVLEDISDRDSSFFLIESAAGTNIKEKKHVAYILVVNKDKTVGHNVNYDLDIIPVPEISYFDGVYFFLSPGLTNLPIHTFISDTTETKDTFPIMPGVFREFADEYYSPLSYNIVITDSTVVATASSDHINQTITYNFVTGNMVIYDRENWGGLTSTSTIDIREMTMVLKDVWLKPQSSGPKFWFATLNTLQTIEVIQSISLTRTRAVYDNARQEYGPTVTTTYLHTDYNDIKGDLIPNIVLHIIFY